MDGNLVADNLKTQGVADASPHDTEVHLRTLGPSQTTHNLFLWHLHAGNGGVVDAHNTVAGQNACFLRRAVGHGLYDEQRVFHHVKLHADALEVTLQGLVHLFHLLGGGIAGVRVKLFEHSTNAVFDEFLLVNAVDIEIGDGQLGHLQLPQWRVGAEVDAHLGI